MPRRDLLPIRDRRARQARPPRGHGRRPRRSFDADGDGLPDLFLCNGGPIVAEAGQSTRLAGSIRNKGNWRFEDITDRAGAPGPSYAMGAAVGDYDGDGRDDLFVTGWRDQRLYRNLGGGRFEDVTRRPG